MPIVGSGARFPNILDLSHSRHLTTDVVYMMRERRGAKKGQPAGKTDIAQHKPDVERVNTDSLNAANFEGQPTPLSNRSVAVLCSLLAAILYANTLGHDYTFDDLVSCHDHISSRLPNTHQKCT